MSELNFNECMNSITNFEWTDQAVNGLRKNIMSQLNQGEYSKTNDIEKYCDCLIEEYTKLPVAEVSNSNFYNTTTNRSIDSVCNSKSTLK